jgi:hypothetical protein
MAVYLTLASVAARLGEKVTEAERLLGLSVLNTSEFQFEAIYTKEELKAFNAVQGPSVFLIVTDDDKFKELIPERQNGVMNYMRLNNEKALARVSDVLKQKKSGR